MIGASSTPSITELLGGNTRDRRFAPSAARFALAAFTAAALAGCVPGHVVAAPLPPGPAPASGVDIATARTQLAALPVKGRAPKTGYSRIQFGQAWSDDVDTEFGHNGCDTRSDILRRDLHNTVVRKGGCVVESGILFDPYTGRTITYTRGARTGEAVQIDHVVPLSLAWQTGAQQLSDRDRRNLANDPLNLLAVDGPTNQAKGDSDAATWLPPNKAERCDYAQRQIGVKTRYHLWVTPPEHDALARLLAAC